MVPDVEKTVVVSAYPVHSRPPNGSCSRSRNWRMSSLVMKGTRSVKSASELMSLGLTLASSHFLRTRADRS